MTTEKQPEALRLATCLQNGADDPMWVNHCEMNKLTCEKAAAELRRLHARLENLENALLEIQQVACSNSPELHISTKALA